MKRAASGWWSGLAGVVVFSGSLPATRLAVVDLDPVFLTLARASIAGVLAAVLLVAGRQQRPHRTDLLPLALVSLGVVVGFPLASALALERMTSAHAMVFIGALPLCTAVFAVLRGGERPRTGFWLWAGLGSALVAGFALAQGVVATPVADALMLLAIVVCGMGYAEGARLARRLGGWQVICWALVLALPLMLPLAALALAVRARPLSLVGAPAWFGLAYVSLFSMLVGFVFWYRGLALGGTAAVGQLQLLQPFLGLTLAATLLGEAVTGTMLAASVAVLACVAGARRCTVPPGSPTAIATQGGSA